MVLKKALASFFYIIILYGNSHGQWVSTFGPITGNITGFATDRTYVFASAFGGIVFMSNNQGKDWTQLYQGIMNPYVMDVHTAFGKVFCAGSHIFQFDYSRNQWDTILSTANPAFNSINSDNERIIATSMYDGVYISNDSAKTWINSKAGLPEDKGYTIPLNSVFSNGKTIFLGSNGYIARSVDTGTSWDAKTFYGRINRVFGLANRVFIITRENGLHYSEDEGHTWKKLDSANTDLKYPRDMLYHRGMLFLSNVGSLYYSYDSGYTWIKDTFPDNLTFSSLGAIDNIILGGTNNGYIWKKSYNFPLSVQNNDEIPRYVLYPNPVDEELSIRSTVNIDRISLFNLAGTQIDEYQNVNSRYFCYKRKDTPVGFYLLRVIDSEGQSRSFKVVFK